MTTPVYTTTEQKMLWGPLDEMGLLVDLTRLPGERSFFYRNRILDVGLHKPASTHIGMLNSVSRELSRLPIYSACTLDGGRIDDVADEELVDPTAVVEINSVGLFYDANSLESTEVFTVDPVTLTLTLAESTRFARDVKITNSAGTIAQDDYVVDVDAGTVRFKDQDYGSTSVTVVYNYRKFFSFFNADNSFATVAELKTSIDTFTVGGNKRMLFEVTDSTANAYPAAYLSPMPPVVLGSGTAVLTVYKLRLFEIYSGLVQNLYLNQYGHAYGTQLEGWAKEIAVEGGITWESCELNWSQWDIVGKRYLGVLPHLYDNANARYFSTDPTDTTTYSYNKYRYYGGYGKYGLIPLRLSGANYKHYASGAGHADSLFVIDLVAQET